METANGVCMHAFEEVMTVKWGGKCHMKKFFSWKENWWEKFSVKCRVWKKLVFKKLERRLAY